MSISVQKQIKDNATEVSTYFSDLYSWTEEQGKRETRRQGRPTADLAAAAAAGAGGEPAAPSAAAAKAEERKLSLQRDGTAMPKYYHDWDRVDVDKLAEDLDEEARRQQQAERAARQAQKDSILDDLALKGDGDRSRTSAARPRVKVAVRASGRRVAPVDLAAPKKEEANRYLAEGRHREAVATYTAALELLERYEPPGEAAAQATPAAEPGAERPEAQAGDCAGENTEAVLLKTALLANRSLALMKLEEWRDAAADCTEALRFDPQHHKATLRRGFAHARLKLWARAVPDLRRAVAGDPGDRRAAAELQMACRMLEEQSAACREHAKRAMCDPTRSLTMPLRKLAVRVHRAGAGAGAPEGEPPLPGATAAATAQVLRAAAAEVDGEGAAAARPAAAPGAAPAPRQPYVPRAVRMRGRQAGQSAAMQAALVGGGAAAPPPAGPGPGAAAPGPSGPPVMNFYTFAAQWNRHGSRPAERVALLRRAGAGALPELFRESLDPELLAAIVEALSSEAAAGAPDAVALAPAVLEALSRTPRFETSARCLSAAERRACAGLLERLGAAGACDEAQLERLRAAFQPPVRRQAAPAEDSDDAAEAEAAGGAAAAPPALDFSLDGCD